ncbi:MAG TPA: RHS repeat-associated core domain-containing protein [Candidatus Hydrogenedentes bacterium]|nr:RHS repeat-associated core domain-containing protein [Candidatus Hydrogenedentota bacterium]
MLFGKRRNKTLDLASATWWRWDLGWNPIQEYTDPDADWDIENLAATFVPGMAEIPGGDPSTGSYRYYMGDHLGSVRTLRDQNKAAIASYEFMPYGETYLQSGRELYRGFTGHMLEKETGLYFAPFRYYSPVSGRWLTRDPLGMAAGLNMYAYVMDSPANAVDPLGLAHDEFPPHGPWGVHDFFNHYWFGHGVTVSFNDVGRINDLRNHWRVRDAVELQKQGAEGACIRAARQVCSNYDPACCEAPFEASFYHEHLITFRIWDWILFVLGTIHLNGDSHCKGKADCCTRRYNANCTHGFSFEDDFNELFFGREDIEPGTPYKIKGWFAEYSSHSGTF